MGMLILPCIYVALTLAACWGVYFFATHYFLPIWQWPVGRSFYSIILRIICSVTPLLVGTITAFFMIKPLFARRSEQMQPVALNPEIDQRVFQLVNAVCELLGASFPIRIDLNCSVNAAAGFDGGLAGMLKNRLVLTLGLPLVAGLTQRELAGVIAHEFGHFRQGAGMRLSYLIRRVNGWFARVVYERDSWDEALDDIAESSEGWARFMVACAQCGVWISRGILWVLMTAGHAISAFLLRQMEYDADGAEIELAGSGAFESTTLKLGLLQTVFSELHLEMRRSWRNRYKLPDNLPVLVQHRLDTMPMEKRQRVENSVVLGKTGLLDTHPSPADRVMNARRLARDGYEINDEPAQELFENFNAVSKMVTLAYYEDDLNVPATEGFLTPVESVLPGSQTE